MEAFGQRWAPSIVLALTRGAERFTDIVAAVPGLSARMPSVRLKQLETARLVEGMVVPTTPVAVRYHLTPRGVGLITALQHVAGYVQRWETGPGTTTSSL